MFSARVWILKLIDLHETRKEFLNFIAKTNEIKITMATLTDGEVSRCLRNLLDDKEARYDLVNKFYFEVGVSLVL